MSSTLSTRSDADSLDTRLADGFAERLAPHFVLEQLESHPSSIFGLFPEGQIAYVNPAWVHFALENGALTTGPASEWIGQRYLDVIVEPLKPFYEQLFSLAPDAGSDVQPVSHVYECSTPTVFRQFAMKVYGLAKGEGFIVVNTLVASRPHDLRSRVAQPPNRALYASADGIISQCAHCRLVRRADGSRWDWVPAWIEQLPVGMSHGVCEVCFGYYYPDVPPVPRVPPRSVNA